MNNRDKAQEALAAMKTAIENYVSIHANGVTATEIARDLGLESDFEGSQKNYLSWSVVGLLVNEGRLRYEKEGRGKRYFVARS